MRLKPNRSGFLTHWLISGPDIHPFHNDSHEEDQIAHEVLLKSRIRDEECTPPPEIKLGARFLRGMPWRYHYAGCNWLIELDGELAVPAKADACAATILCAERPCTVAAVLWSYAAIDLWVNGEKACVIEAPVYKPIHRREIDISLQAGENLIFLRMQAFCSRDPHTLFGLQLLSPGAVSVTLPDAGSSLRHVKAGEWLDRVQAGNGALTFPRAPEGAFIRVDSERRSIAGKTMVALRQEQSLEVVAVVDGVEYVRRLEFLQHIQPAYLPVLPQREHVERYYGLLGEREAESRGNGIYFGTYQVLARFYSGDVTQRDYELIWNDLSIVENRLDCSEFTAAGLLRLYRAYDLGNDLKREFRRVFLGYRYWMDEPGDDGMCFWSENHALMFYGVQYVAGSIWPDARFIRSGRTGREQMEIAAQRCRDWLSDIEQGGFEEFLSANYVPVTMGALLNLIDFGPEALSRRAAAVLDRQLEQVARHSFNGTVFGPQGRIYRDCVYPFQQGSQGLLHFIDGRSPYDYCMWIAALATSRYQVPQQLRALIDSERDDCYTSGNARIVLRRRQDYVLTSVQSPRDADDPILWKADHLPAGADKASNAYVRVLNERFHGTSWIRPGVYGYQQHLWHAALSTQCAVFTNHPGTASDAGSMRPGYWFGNGVMPAIRQRDNRLGVVYHIPREHPIHFTHLFWPKARFACTVEEKGWLFGRLGGGYLAVWCSSEPEPHSDVLSDCEYRLYGDASAYLCICSSAAETGEWEQFMRQCRSLSPAFDPDTLTLTTKDGYSLSWVAHADTTQYV